MLGGEVKRQAKVQKLAEARVGRVDTLPSQGLIFKSKAAQMACEVGFHRRRLSFAAVQSQASFFYSNCKVMVLEKQLGGEAEPWQQDERKLMRCELNMQVC